MIDKKKLKMHLESALACLDEGYEGSDMAEDSSSDMDGDEADEDFGMKSMKMKLAKYKE